MIGADDDPHLNYEFACKVMRLLPIGRGSTFGADSQPSPHGRAAARARKRSDVVAEGDRG
jgi:hypothetical protein